MKRGHPVKTGHSHNKKAKTYATTNKDRNPLSRKQSASSGSAKKLLTLCMKVSSKKPNSNNDKNTTVTNNINDLVKNITNNGNNIGSRITNINLASVSIELSATVLKFKNSQVQESHNFHRLNPLEKTQNHLKEQWKVIQ